MNKDDLLALVWSATSGWMPSSERELSRTPKGRAHQRLLALVQQSGSSRNALQVLRKRLIQEINHTSKGLLEDALRCIDALKGSSYAIEAPADSADRIHRLAFDRVPPSSSAREALRLTLALRRLPATEQILAMRLSEAYDELDYREQEAYSLLAVARLLEQDEGLSEHERAALQTDISEEKFDELRAAANIRTIRVKRMWPKLAQRTRDLLEDPQYNFPTGIKQWGALAVQIPLHATDLELQDVSRWTRMAGASMYRPLPVDESCGASQARAFRRAWGQYKECGHGLQLLSAWTESMATTSEGERCQICYRQVGADGRRYCYEHRRKPEVRQKTRDLHVSSFYKPLALKDIRAAERLTERFGNWRRSAATMRHMQKVAGSQGINEDLVQSAADLATTLRTLKPLLRPVVIEQLAEVFRSMLEQARQPYLENSNGDWVRERDLNEARAQAPMWLTWRTLLMYIFSGDVAPPWTSRPLHGLNVDSNHPAAEGLPVLPGRVAVDLLHVGAWQAVDVALDKYLYLDRDELVALRHSSSLPGGQMLSLAEIGRKLGASHEAVRQNLAHAEGKPSRTSHRRRTVASGAERLRRELGMQS